MHLGAWKFDLELPERKVVPKEFPVYGNISIDRPIVDYKKPNDPLVGLLPRPPKYTPKHAPTVWGREAYAKSLKNFFMLNQLSLLRKNTLGSGSLHLTPSLENTLFCRILM